MIIWDISFTQLSKFNFLQNAIYFHILLNILHIFIFNATIQSINLCLHYHNYLTIGTYILFVFMCMYVCMYLLTNNKTNKKKSSNLEASNNNHFISPFCGVGIWAILLHVVSSDYLVVLN